MLGQPTVEPGRYGIDFPIVQRLVPLFVIGARCQNVLAMLFKQIVQGSEDSVLGVLPHIFEDVAPEKFHDVGIISGGQYDELLFAVVGR